MGVDDHIQGTVEEVRKESDDCVCDVLEISLDPCKGVTVEGWRRYHPKWRP